MIRIIGKTRLWITIAATFLAMALLAWPRAAAGGISRGLSVCAGVILPSLFPFLVLGGFLVRSGVAAAIGRRLSPLTRPLFGLPGCCAAAILIAFIGGYPAGANAVGQLRREGQITREEGQHLLRFCVCGGPGFIVNAVGVGMTGNGRFGWLLFAANLLAALILGVFSAPMASRRRAAVSPLCAPRLSSAAALVDSVTAACESALYMCGFILLFSALLSLCDASGIMELLRQTGGDRLCALLPCLLEVSSGCTAAASVGEGAPLLLGFALGFGGLSVHCQAAAALRGTDLLSSSFFLFRMIHGVLGGLLTVMLFALIPLPLPVFGTFTPPVVQAFSGSAVISVALLLLCGIWMLTVSGSNAQRSR